MYVYIPCTLKAVLSRDAYEYEYIYMFHWHHWLQQFVKCRSLRTYFLKNRITEDKSKPLYRLLIVYRSAKSLCAYVPGMGAIRTSPGSYLYM